MVSHHRVTPDIEILSAHFPIFGTGFLAVNAFVIKAAEPVLVDTGMGIEREEFMRALESIIDPRDLKWVWLTHDDADHTGNIQAVLEAAPGARLAGHCLALLRMSTAWPVPMHRTYWLNSGDSISAGDRMLTAVRPPLFDNPTTIGVFDSKAQTLFSADCFGAVIPSPVQSVDDLSERDLAQGVIGWACADSPWIHMVGAEALNRSLDSIRRMAPKTILSAHLPSAQGRTEYLLDLLAEVPASPPFAAPNQTARE
jgi:glyoxylase-like metal-dependent hydrolase (beta-lactamase superfamily II)